MVDIQDLHLKYVSGEPLLAEELEVLEQWYAQQDAQEASALSVEATLAIDENVQQQIDELFEQIAQEMEQIRKLVQENLEIKAANEMLRTQLVQSAA